MLLPVRERGAVLMGTFTEQLKLGDWVYVTDHPNFGPAVVIQVAEPLRYYNGVGVRFFDDPPNGDAYVFSASNLRLV